MHYCSMLPSIPPLPYFRCHCLVTLVFFTPNGPAHASVGILCPLDPLVLSTSLIYLTPFMHLNDPLRPRMLDDQMKFMVWDDYVFEKRMWWFTFRFTSHNWLFIWRYSPAECIPDSLLDVFGHILAAYAWKTTLSSSFSCILLAIYSK